MNGANRNTNRRILIVDDNSSIHTDFRKILCPSNGGGADLIEDAAAIFGRRLLAPAEQSFQLDSAYQGEEALRMVEAALAAGNPYAVAFVDVRMPPGWDGVETISRIWAVCPDLQVVICTAYSDHSWEEITAQVGKTESLFILKKPFDNVEVLQLAHALTQKWTLQHELKGRLSNLETLVTERTKDLREANASLRREAAEREAAQAALLRSEERFSKAFHANPVPIALVTASDHRFLDANESFREMTGYTCEELRELQIGALQLKYENGDAEDLQGLHGKEASICSKSGAKREVLVSTEAIALADQRCVLTLLVDVTEQRLLEKKLRSAQKLEALGQLAAGVAHNFNNILGVILGHASLQLQTPASGDVEKSLQEIASAAERGAGLVRQLLAAAQQQRKDEEALDLNAVVLRTKHLLAPLLGQHIQLTCDAAENLPSIVGDQSNIEQVLMNLVLNARDALPKGGRINIWTTLAEINEVHAAAVPQARTGTFVQLSVADNGTGMDAATLERIFEPFFTTKPVGVGTGLGLATVHGIVGQHGGWLEVSSKPKQGSTFRVYLPISQSAAVQPSRPTVPENARAAAGETVLLVEDEPGLRHIVRLTLERNGYRVLVADNAPKALSIWSNQHEQVDLLLTDLTMPGGLSGFELADKLRARRPNLPVIFSSGYAPERTADADKYNGATFLQKPYTVDGVLKAVRTTLTTA